MNVLPEILFGQRSVDELGESRADCFARKEGARILLSILFPKRTSSPAGLM